MKFAFFVFFELTLPSFSVDADCLILQLKGEIEAQTGVPANEQRLIYGGASMTDYRSMASYSISSDAVIYMVISLQG